MLTRAHIVTYNYYEMISTYYLLESQDFLNRLAAKISKKIAPEELRIRASWGLPRHKNIP